MQATAAANVVKTCLQLRMRVNRVCMQVKRVVMRQVTHSPSPGRRETAWLMATEGMETAEIGGMGIEGVGLMGRRAARLGKRSVMKIQIWGWQYFHCLDCSYLHFRCRNLNWLTGIKNMTRK